MANSVDPDQTAPRSSLIWVSTVLSDLSLLIQHFKYYTEKYFDIVSEG